MLKKISGVLVGVSALGLATSANAVVDPAITTAIANGSADGVVIGSAILAMIVVVSVFRHMRRAV